MSQGAELPRLGSMSNLVVLGGGYAGILAALRLARQSRRAVTLVSERDVLVERIRLHEVAAHARSVEHPIAKLLRGTRVNFMHTEVLHVDPEAQRIVCSNAELSYEHLIVALGSFPSHIAVSSAYFSPSLADARRLCTLLHERSDQAHVLVVGGGLTGIEYAAELASAAGTMRVTLLARTLASQLSEAARSYIRSALQRLGVVVVEEVDVQAYHAAHVGTSKGEVSFDACVIAAGVQAPRLLRASGLACNAHGQLLVAKSLQAAPFANVWVAGDAAALPVHGSIGCKSAMPMGAHAADNVARVLTGLAPLPLLYRDPGVCVSLGRRDAVFQRTNAAGDPIEVIITGRAAALIKEVVCKSTLLSLRMEQRGFRYRWSAPSAQA